MTDRENLEGITSLKKRIKTKDLSQLEMGSGLDKQESKQNLISLTSENEKLKSAISKNENQLRMLNHVNAEKESIINQLIEENTRLKTAHQEKINDLTKENNKLNNIIADLNTYGFEDGNTLQELQKSISLLNDKINTMNTELINKDNEIDFLNGKLEESSLKVNNLNEKITENDEKTSQLINKNNDLKKNLSEKDNQIKVLKNNIAQEYSNIADKLKSQLDENKKTISDKDKRINSLNDKISSLNNENKSLNDKISNLSTENSQLKQKEEKLDLIQQQYARQRAKFDSIEYGINCINDELENNRFEIQYLENNTFIRKLLNPLSYGYLIVKSSPKELSINLKLYRAIKNSKSFDVGFYLKNNKDIQNSKWCKYFSPQLHYVCNGFKEKRVFSKKHFNTNSKEGLLEDILNSQ